MPQSNSSFSEEQSYNYSVLKKSRYRNSHTLTAKSRSWNLMEREKKKQLLNNSNKKSYNSADGTRKSFSFKGWSMGQMLSQAERRPFLYHRAKPLKQQKLLVYQQDVFSLRKKSSAKSAKGKKDFSILRPKVFELDDFELNDFEHHVSCLTFLQKLIPKFQLSH